MYAANWCSGGPYAAAEKQQWALGESFHYPEENCCTCGKGIAELDEREWGECESHFGHPPSGGRRCPDYDVSAAAALQYLGVSIPARSAGYGNPCMGLFDAGSCEADTRCHWDPAGGGRLGTDSRDATKCKLKPDAKNYAEGFRSVFIYK